MRIYQKSQFTAHYTVFFIGTIEWEDEGVISDTALVSANSLCKPGEDADSHVSPPMRSHQSPIFTCYNGGKIHRSVRFCTKKAGQKVEIDPDFHKSYCS